MNGPILITHTANDKAVGIAYALALANLGRDRRGSGGCERHLRRHRPEWGRQDSRLGRALSGCQLNFVLHLDGMPDQATRPLDEGKLVCETALKKHANSKMAGYVGHRDQRHVLGDA